jgi:hypothetical protein
MSQQHSSHFKISSVAIEGFFGLDPVPNLSLRLHILAGSILHFFAGHFHYQQTTLLCSMVEKYAKYLLSLIAYSGKNTFSKRQKEKRE